MTPEQHMEMNSLRRTGYMLILLYPQHYEYDQDSDTYTEIKDKHAWYGGSGVRRLRELMAMEVASCAAVSATAS